MHAATHHIKCCYQDPFLELIRPLHDASSDVYAEVWLYGWICH